jgi:hypothetical protein
MGVPTGNFFAGQSAANHGEHVANRASISLSAQAGPLDPKERA